MVIWQAIFQNFLVSSNIMWVQLNDCVSANQRLVSYSFHCWLSPIFQHRIFKCLTLASTAMYDFITDLLHVQVVYFSYLRLSHELNFNKGLWRTNLFEISILARLIDKGVFKNPLRRQQRFFFSRLLKLRCHD